MDKEKERIEDRFSVIIGPTKDLQRDLPYRNLAQMVFNPAEREDPASPTLIAHKNDQIINISLDKLRAVLSELMGWLVEKGIGLGDTVCILRLSHTSELPVALMYGASSVMGSRVLLPMSAEPDELRDWIEATRPKVAFRSGSEDIPSTTRAQMATMDDILEEEGCPVYDLIEDVHIYGLIEGQGALDIPLVEDAVKGTDLDTPTVVLSTSGSTGRSKLVAYDQSSILRSCLAWEVAGLFKGSRRRYFTPLFSHSMGVRTFWNALWSRSALCLITPELLVEGPERAAPLLERMSPDHITSGPAMFNVFKGLGLYGPGREQGPKPRSIIGFSSGVPFDKDTASDYSRWTGGQLHNAYGLTETMQVTNSMLGGPPGPCLGMPLPGVSIGLEEYEGPLYRLYVRSPFGSKGYLLGAEDGMSGFVGGGWFCTGDIVHYEGSGLEFAGREGIDFIKDGFGLKIPISVLGTIYGEAIGSSLLTHYIPALDSPGIAALFIGKSIDVPPAELHGRLVSTVSMLGSILDPFSARHLRLRRYAILKEEPGLTHKGTLSRKWVEGRHADLIRALMQGIPDERAIHV